MTCELITRRDAGDAPRWDSIWRTPFWDVVHSYNASLLGWTVLVSRRHIAAIDEMRSAEAQELGTLLQKVGAGLKEITGCEKSYVMQFAEAPIHRHVHFHVVPRMADMPEDRRATKVFGYLGVDESERMSEAEMNQFAIEMRLFLSSRTEEK